MVIESAGGTPLKGDLMAIVKARRLSQATMSTIRQNLFFAFVYNAARVPIGDRRALSLLRDSAFPHHRGYGDGPKLARGSALIGRQS